jgi:type IV pilus assembly protein PilE
MRSKNGMRGVTLIELLIVIVVIGILASIAVGSYRRYLMRANRVDGTTQLLRVQVAEEKYFVQNNTYSSGFGTDAIGMSSSTGVTTLTSPQGFYTITVVAGSSGALTSSYSATATAIAGQAQDTQCATMTINDQGIKTSSPGAASVCWH